MQNLLEDHREDLKELCESLKVERLYAFSSVVSGRFRNDSDINFLMSFSKDLTIEEYTENYLALHYQLRALFNREVDIVTERTLSNPY